MNGQALIRRCMSISVSFGVRAVVKKGLTAPPKRYTEATLLAAMESTGADSFPDEAGRKGIGTPATRAGIIEKLVKGGFIERRGEKIKQLLPTDKGRNLIAVLPENAPTANENVIIAKSIN